MSKKVSFRFIIILVLQCLLLMRILVPAIHYFVHGADEAICGEAALCELSKFSSIDKKENSKPAEIIQLSLADMHPAAIVTYRFAAQAGCIQHTYSSVDMALRNVSLALVLPPPKC